MNEKETIRLAIVTTHPIQYNAPLFKKLAQTEGLTIKVFYTWGEGAINKFDPGFGKTVEWNIPLLGGYDYCFVKNTASEPGSHHFRGIDNPSLINEVEQWQPSAILVYGWAFKSHLRLMRAFHGKIPVLFRGDSTSLERSKSLKRLFRRLFLQWVYHHVDMAFYTGTHNRHYFEEHGLRASQLLFMPHAVDNDRFRREAAAGAEKVRAWKSSSEIAPQTLVFLYAGKLDNNKNVFLLLTAFIRAKLPNATLVIAGNGPLESELIRRFDTSPLVRFIPFQNQTEMPLLYAKADVFVLPSKTETWGLGINEAMACRKAILVSSGCAAATDLVKDGWNGFVFKNNNEEDLIKKLQTLAHNKPMVLEMGNRSARMIESWSYEADCVAVLNALKRLNKNS